MFHGLSLNDMLSRKRKRKLPRKSKRIFLHRSPVFCLSHLSMFALLAFQSTWHQPSRNTHISKYDLFPAERKLLNSANLWGFLNERIINNVYCYLKSKSHCPIYTLNQFYTITNPFCNLYPLKASWHHKLPFFCQVPLGPLFLRPYAKF